MHDEDELTPHHHGTAAWLAEGLKIQQTQCVLEYLLHAIIKPIVGFYSHPMFISMHTNQPKISLY